MKVLVNCKGAKDASIRATEILDPTIPSNLKLGKGINLSRVVDVYMMCVARRIAELYPNKKIGLRYLEESSIGSLPNYHGYIIFVNEDFPTSMISHLITWDFIDPDGGNVQFEDLI